MPITNRSKVAFKKTSGRSDSTTNPSWLINFLSEMPYVYRWPSLASLRKRAAECGYPTCRDGIERMIIDAVSRDVRREALRLYGPNHPQAQADYYWKPCATRAA